MMTIQVNLCFLLKGGGQEMTVMGGGNTNSHELSLLKFLSLTYHHSHFLAATFDFTSFFHPGFFGGCTLFSQLGCF